MEMPDEWRRSRKLPVALLLYTSPLIAIFLIDKQAQSKGASLGLQQRHVLIPVEALTQE